MIKPWRRPILSVLAAVAVWPIGGLLVNKADSVLGFWVMIAVGTGAAFVAGLGPSPLRAMFLTATAWGVVALVIYLTADPTCPGLEGCSGDQLSSWNSAVIVLALGLVMCVVTGVGGVCRLATNPSSAGSDAHGAERDSPLE